MKIRAQYESATYGDIMIVNSQYWKNELVELVEQFNMWSRISDAKSETEDWHDERRFKLERSLFYSALVIRRLIDSRKITDKLRSKSVQLDTLQSLKQFPDSLLSSLGFSKIYDDFDFQNPKLEKLSSYKIASEILHSVTLDFISTDSENNIESVIVAYEHNRFLRAIKIPIYVWTALLNEFINDRVTKFEASLDSDKSKLIIDIK